MLMTSYWQQLKKLGISNMLKSQRDRQTLSILERLKQGGMPSVMSPVPTPGDEGDFEDDTEHPELDAMGQSLMAPLRKPKKKPLVDEGSY